MPPSTTQGRRELLAVLQVISRREVAARTRVDPSVVSRWASGVTVPNAEHARALHVQLGVPSDSWAR